MMNPNAGRQDAELRMLDARDSENPYRPFYLRVFDTWVPTAMFFVDFILVVVVALGVGIGRTDGVEPWKMSVYTLTNYGLLDTVVDTFSTKNPWSTNTTPSEIATRTAQLGVDLHIPNANNAAYPFYHCVYEGAVKAIPDLTAVATEVNSQHIMRDLAWACSRSNPVPMEIKESTQLDLLLCALVWCTNAMLTRTYTMYSLKDKGDRMQVWMIFSTTVFATLSALAVFGYGVYEASKQNSDMSIVGVGLLLVSAISLVWTAWTAIWESRTGMDITAVNKRDLTGARFNASWVIIGLLKPLLVAPVYVLIVLGFCGITEFYSLLVCSILSIVLALTSSTLSYYNLYASHRGMLEDDQNNEQEMDARKQDIDKKSRRPHNVILTAVVILIAICFTSWPKRSDLSVLWDTEFGIFFLVFGLGSMVVPDVIYFNSYKSAMVLREQAELLFRILLVMMLLSFVFA